MISDLAGYLRKAAARQPSHPAVVGPDGTVWTYAELRIHAGRVARFLATHGVGDGDRVGLMVPKCCEAVAVIFGTLQVGAAYVPVDPLGSATRAATIFADCGIRALFADAASLQRLAATGASGGILTVAVPSTGEDEGDGPPPGTVAWDEVLRAEGEAPDTSATRGDRLAYVLYTSGSTGVPKGVAITHTNAAAFIEWCSNTFEITAYDRVSSHAPLHFDLSIFDIFVSVKNGATIYLIGEALAASPRHLPKFITQSRITVWYSAPAILGMIADRIDPSIEVSREPRNQLRLVLFAGEVFPVAKLRRLCQLWPHPTYYNFYGPTETNVCTFARIPDVVSTERVEPYPIGNPCSHCDILIVDEQNSPVGSGQSGFLCVAGPSVFPGYWGRHPKNERCFFIYQGRRWYNTGDVVCPSPDGLVFRGRRDRMVKRHSYRIELDEIERVLALHPELQEAAVVASMREDTCAITAFLVARESRLSPLELRQFCHATLARYMTPDAFFYFDALPRTSTGKIDYQKLQVRCG